MIELFLGGTRSGKSKLAEQAASASGKHVVYIATATASDRQMQQRIERHRSSRPPHWKVLEQPFFLAEAIAEHASQESCILVDCLTLWLSNCLFHKEADFFLSQRQLLLKSLNNAAGQIILVSNETNMGVIPMGEVTREFCDRAGELHQEIAAISDRVTLAVAGLPLVLKNQ